MKTLSLALFMMIVGCSGKTAGTSGTGGVGTGGVGTGGVGTGGVGTGGAPACDSGPECCPAFKPDVGDACNTSVVCPYQACGSAKLQASCVDGSWNLPHVVGCVSASCDFTGTWDTQFDDAPGANEIGPHAPPLKLTLTEKDGAIFSESSTIQLSADACTIKATWSDRYDFEIDGQPAWEETTEVLTLATSGDTGTGTYSYSCEGECGFEYTFPISAARTKP